MRKLHVLLLLMLPALFFTGCATKITTEYVIPAKSTEVTKYRNIAVTEFGGNEGQKYSYMLEAYINGITYKGKKMYELVDRITVKRIIDEQKFQMAVADDSTVVQLGKLVGVDAIWTGFVTESSNDSPSYETRSKCTSYIKNVCQSYNQYTVRCLRRTVNLIFQPKLVSVQTGKIIYTKAFEINDSSSACSDSMFQPQSAESMLSNLREKSFKQFRTDIAPTIASIELELKDDTKGLVDKPTIAIFENGIEFAKNGRMERACEIWRDLIKNNLSSISLNYNIGICYEVEGNMELALKQMQATDKLLVKPDELVSQAIKRNQSNIARLKDLNEQVK